MKIKSRLPKTVGILSPTEVSIRADKKSFVIYLVVIMDDFFKMHVGAKSIFAYSRMKNIILISI